MSVYKLLDTGNIIVADIDFMQANYMPSLYEYVGESEAPAPQSPPAYLNYIDIGPFFDRFGSQKLTVLISQDQTVKALLADIQIRKWIDLSLPEVQQAVVYIANLIPAVVPLVPSILATPVQDHENLALRKLYFS